VLRQVLREHLPAFKARVDEADRPLPAFVERELEAIMGCADPRRGLTRWHCDNCGHDELLPFSCKSRACSRCGARRMAETAAFLVDHLIPRAPVRHWTITFPPPLRYALAYDAELCSEVIGIFARMLLAWQRRLAKSLLGLRSVSQAHGGSIVAIHRARSDLRLNLHLHAIQLDGVFVETAQGEQPTFHALPTPKTVEVQQLAWEICQRTTRRLQRRGVYLDADPEQADTLARDEPLLATLASASIRGVVALGEKAGQPLWRLGTQSPVDPTQLTRRQNNTPAHGFNLHCGRRVPARDKKGRERLARYILRPPVAEGRLSRTKDGRVVYRFRRPFSDGSTAATFEPLDFLAKVIPLIARPRVNQTRYFGLFAPRSKLRAQIIPQTTTHEPTTPRQLEMFRPASTTESRAAASAGTNADSSADNPVARRYRYTRAQLFARIFQADIECCPRCFRGRLRLVAVITDDAAIAALLAAAGWGPRLEKRNPAARPRAPPQLQLPFPYPKRVARSAA
jgi:hypothetical protein